MVLPCLDWAFGCVATMVVRGDQLVGHADVLDFLLVCLRYFVVHDMVHRHDALCLHF